MHEQECSHIRRCLIIGYNYPIVQTFMQSIHSSNVLYTQQFSLPFGDKIIRDTDTVATSRLHEIGN